MSPTAPAPARPLWPAVLATAIGAAVLLTFVCWTAIAHQYYPDPDDTLRRLEVRDLLAGQSWWDVSQHRLASGSMHWSRLVDLPLAAIILPLRPLLGEIGAERVAMVVVPLATFGIAMALMAYLTRRLLDDEHARLALIVAPLSVAIIQQMRPMRIDHHGWQIVFALTALYAFVAPRPNARSGAVGGMMLAILLTISLEGLPVAAALLGLVALGWALDPARRPQLVAAGASVFGMAALLHLATRGPAFLTPACDAMAPVWLAVIGVAAATSGAATLFGRAPLPVRLALLVASATAGGATLVLIDSRCLSGPFGMLDPVVRHLWYEKVPEGLPIWHQSAAWAALDLGLPLVGLVGALIACRDAAGARRASWLFTIGAQLAALLVAIQVERAAGVANAFAAPGGTVVLLALLQRARRISFLPLRTVGTAGALLSASPALPTVPLLLHGSDEEAEQSGQLAAAAGRAPCQAAEDVRALAALPAGTLFAPLDIAPEIIAGTGHRAIASGHHRNVAAMGDVIRTFTGAPDQARAIIAKYRAAYLVGCPGAIETGLYAHVAPRGLWARLERGERFAWLDPVRVPGSPVLAWRIHDRAPLRTAPPAH